LKDSRVTEKLKSFLAELPMIRDPVFLFFIVMRIKMKKWLIISIILLMTQGTCSANQISPEIDYLFMHYRENLRDHKGQPDNAIFAMGEYYFLMKDFHDAEEYFNKYLSNGKNRSQKLFSYAYLLKIAESQGQKNLAKKLAKEMTGFRKNVFIFSKSKQESLRSPLKRLHKIIYSIDKVEVYVEGELLAKVIY
jgi:tetratricopeptide (TPR) repeat protein